MKSRLVKIQSPQPDDALRVGDFELMPTNPVPPVITSHPLRNFHQLTWRYPRFVGDFLGGPQFKLELRKANPTVENVFLIRQGTALSWGLFASDPANVTNPSSLENVEFVWTKDGQPLHEYNRLNDGQGTQFISITEKQCTPEINGEYVCQVSNDIGSVNSVAFSIEVIDTENTNRLYTNLLLNGDGGGLDSWTNTDGLIKTDVVSSDRTLNQSTMTLFNGNGFPISTGSNYRGTIPFSFKQGVDEGQLFYGGFDRWLNITGEDLVDLNKTNSQLNGTMPDWLVYGNISQRVPYIPNEDYGKQGIQGFFPGIKYIDSYNRNRPPDIRLQDEFGNSPLTLFTRNPISFDEPATATFYQDIDITDLQPLIDGDVGGIDYMSAQFFSYVACGLSRYTIRTIQNGQAVDYNYMVHDIETIRAYLSGESPERIRCDIGSPIEIIPHADDTTTISVECLGANGVNITTKEYKGPTALDLWAVKEKVDWPLTLYPIFAFFEQRRNPIKVFGQVYTNTEALDPLFANGTNNLGNLHPDNLQYMADAVTDVNAKFILQRYGEYNSTWSKPWPGAIWEDTGPYYVNISEQESRQYKSYVDKGISAFFAVGGTIDIPTKTESIRVTVNFTNDSPARIDSSPENKGWEKTEIYNTIFNVKGTENTVGNPYYDYGNPRCGITKMKLVLVPNRDVASPNHTTYEIPPSEFTTLGIARQSALSAGNDGSEKSEFRYKLFQPEGLPPSPDPTLISQQTEDTKEDYKLAVESGANIDPTTRLAAGESPEELADLRAFQKTSIDIEERDRLASGDPEAGTVVGPTATNPDTTPLGPDDLPDDPASQP